MRITGPVAALREDVDEKDDQRDWESTTAVLARRAPGLAWLPSALRQRLTPAALGGAVTALAIAIAYVVGAQHDIRRLQESAAVSERDRAQDRDLLQQLVTGQAVMNGKVDSIATEVDRQREWREGIEREAEAPPHARRRK
jgi:hypothetical protein